MAFAKADPENMYSFIGPTWVSASCVLAVAGSCPLPSQDVPVGVETYGQLIIPCPYQPEKYGDPRKPVVRKYAAALSARTFHAALVAGSEAVALAMLEAPLTISPSWYN